MMEYMNFRCSECGNWIDCTREEFEERGGLCEDCHGEIGSDFDED